MMDVQQTISALEWWLNHNKQNHYDVLDGNLKVAIESAIDNLKNNCVKHGHWIGIEFDGYYDGFPVYSSWECSKCGNEIETEDTPLYCFECGAKMDQEARYDVESGETEGMM